MSHPQIISLFLEAIDATANPSVCQELIWALVFIRGRHMPDLRCRSYFYNALESKDATNRWLGLMDLGYLSDYSLEKITRLESDRSKKVREKAQQLLSSDKKREFSSWFFNN